MFSRIDGQSDSPRSIVMKPWYAFLPKDQLDSSVEMWEKLEDIKGDVLTCKDPRHEAHTRPIRECDHPNCILRSVHRC